MRVGIGTLLVLSSFSVIAFAQNDVPFLTVTSRDRTNVVEFLNPPEGDYLLTRVIGRRDQFASTSVDFGPPPIFVSDVFGIQGKPGFVTHNSLENGQTYYYTVFVFDGGETWSSGARVTGEPIDTSGVLRWRFSTGTGATAMSPPGLGSVVFVLSNDNNVYPLERGPDGGTWAADAIPLHLEAPAQHRTPVITIDALNMGFVAAQDGFVRAVDADTGAPLWQSDFFGMLQGGPAVWLSRFSGFADDVVYVGTRNAGVRNAFHALRALDGSTVWSFDDPGGDGMGIVSGGASIDYVNEVAYLASHEFVPGAGSVWAVDLATGVEKWSTSVGNVSGSPIQRGNVLYVGSDDGKIHALDVANGSLRLNSPFETNDGITKGFVFPDLAGDRVYLSTQTTLWCLRDVGPVLNERWSHPGIPGPSIPTYPPGYQFLWVGSSDGRLHQVDVTTGNPAHPPDSTFVTLTNGSAGVGSPTYDVLNRLIYVGTEDGAVVALTAPF
jgi:outer membrane protein assembly factor BamB